MKTVHGCAAAALGCALLIFLCPASWAIDAERRPPPPPPPEDQTQDAVSFQINPAHTGSIAFTSGFKATLKQLWTRSFSGGVSYPIIAENMVFVTVTAQTGNQLFALNIKTGAIVWQAPVPGTYLVSHAAYDKNNLFVLNFDGVLRKYVAATGSLAWNKQVSLVQTLFFGMPVAADGRVFLGGAGNGGTIFSVDQVTGDVQWGEPVDNGAATIPTVGPDGLYVGYTCERYKFDTTGTPLWALHQNCFGGIGQMSADYDGRFYIPNTIDGALVVDNGTGAIVSTYLSNSIYVPAFFSDANGNKRGLAMNNAALYCFDTATGSVIWNFAGDSQLALSPVVINGFVFVASSSGMLYALNGTTGTKLWSTNTGHGLACNVSTPTTGMGAGQGVLVIPACTQLTAYGPSAGGGRH